MKRALVTGITGQDGSYLAELLLEKGYEVHRIKRRSSSFNTGCIDPIYSDWHQKDCRLFLHLGDLSDSASLWHLFYEVKRDEIYNLAAQSHVRVSFDVPEYTCDITANGALRVLAIRHIGLKTRFYQASSSEMFGSAPPPQNETTPFRPCSPYACAKAFAHQITVNYRMSYNLFACGGILFNHESPRRGETFVTRKIARAVARIKHGIEDKLYLGNLEARRDWGYAPDYVRGIWMMMQQDQPDDYVLGTGENHSVKELLEASFAYANLDWHDHVLF
jgi:GDPmannose 4,6-dehydratase